MLTIEDIMGRGDVFAVDETAGAAEVAWELSVRNLSGAPVADEGGRLVGTITRGDLVDPRRAPRSRGAGRHLSAADVMSEDVLVARASDPAREAVRLLARAQGRPLLVADENDRLVGVVSAADVLAAVARGERFDIEEVGLAQASGVGDCPFPSHG